MVDLDFRLHAFPTLAIQMQTQCCLFVGPDEEEAEVDWSMFACPPRRADCTFFVEPNAFGSGAL